MNSKTDQTTSENFTFASIEEQLANDQLTPPKEVLTNTENKTDSMIDDVEIQRPKTSNVADAKKAKRKKLALIFVGVIFLVVVVPAFLYVRYNNEQAIKDAESARTAQLAAEEKKQQEEAAAKKQQEDEARRAAEEAAAKKQQEDEARRAAEEASTAAGYSKKMKSLESQIKQLNIENAHLKKQLNDALSAKPAIKVEKPVEKPVIPDPPKKIVVDLPRSHCEFKGSLVNRAWIVCDGKLISVKAGDPLPYPYREVVKVNDGQSSGGSVLTTGGGAIE